MLENSAKVEANSVKNALERQRSLQRHFTEVRQRIDAEFNQLSETLEKRREVLVRQFQALQRQQLSLLHSPSPELNGEQCCVAVEFTGQQGIRDFLSTFGRIRAGRGSHIYDIEPCKLEEFREREFYFDKEIGSMGEEKSGDTGGRENKGSSCSDSNTLKVCDTNNTNNSNINYNNSNSIKERIDIKENTCCDVNSESKTNTKSIIDSNCGTISKDKTQNNSDSDCNDERRDKIKDETCDMNSDTDIKNNSNSNSPTNTNTNSNNKNDRMDETCCDVNNDNDTDGNTNSDDKCTNIEIGTNSSKDITDGRQGDALSNADCNKENTNTHKEREPNDNVESVSDEDGAASNNDEKLETSDSNDTASPNRDEISTNNYKGVEISCDNVDASANEIKEENVAFEGREHPEQVKQWLEQILLETDLEPSVNEVERINLRRVLIN